MGVEGQAGGRGGGWVGTRSKPLPRTVVCELRGGLESGLYHTDCYMRVMDGAGGEQHPTTPLKIYQSHHLALAAVISSKRVHYCNCYQLKERRPQGQKGMC